MAKHCAMDPGDSDYIFGGEAYEGRGEGSI